MRFSALIALALAASAAPALAVTLTEDFESLGPKDTPLPSLATAVGLFTPIAPADNVFISSPGYTNYGPGLNPTTTSILTANGDEGFELVLPFLAYNLKADYYLNDLGPATLEFFHGATSVFTIILLADNDSTNNLLSLSLFLQPFDRVTFVSTLGGRLNTGLDNITIQSVPGIPEPASWAMMIGGLGLVGASLRRRATGVRFV